MRNYLMLALVLAPAAALARPAPAGRQVHFLGPHPVAAKYGGGYCYIEAPHFHIYAPDKPALYHQVGDDYVFTGDPTPFGYEGERHPFYGHHPVVMENEGEPVYCFIDGPHYHPYPPPDDVYYKVKNGVAFYIGPFSPAYVKLKPRQARIINAEYRPYVTYRPTVEVAPPPEWHGDVWVAAPSIEVHAPGVYVAPPPRPHVSVEVSAPGVYVAPPPPIVVGPPRVVIGAPPPIVVGPPHVVIGAPPPVVVGAPGVVVGAPGPVVVGGRGHWRREHDYDDDDDDRGRGKWHHDNGRHEGWRKHH